MILKNKEGSVGIATLNYPEKRNILSQNLVRELNEALSEFEQDKQVKVIVLNGAGKSFSVGADLREFEEIIKGSIPQESEDFIEAWTYLSTLEKPVIASVKGHVFGGGAEVMLMADYIIASDTTQFAFPEIHLNLMPGCGGTQRLVERVGYPRAFELCALGLPINAPKALEWGLINEIVREEELGQKTLEVAKLLYEKNLNALKAIKKSLKLREKENGFNDSLAKERQLFWGLLKNPFAHRAIYAFLNKK